MTEEPIDLSEFTEETIKVLGKYELERSTPTVGYTLGLILQNESPTADLEGTYEIQDFINKAVGSGSVRDNCGVMAKFMAHGSLKTPASAATLAATHLDAILYEASASRWLENLAEGFMATGVDQSFQVAAIGRLFTKIKTRLSYEPDSQAFKLDKTDNREHLLIPLTLAHRAVEQGVTVGSKSREELLAFFEDCFCALNQPGGFVSMTKLAHRLTREDLHPNQTPAQKAFRIENVLNPMFQLYVKTATRSEHFGTEARDIFNDLTRLLRTCNSTKYPGIDLFDHHEARSLALKVLMVSDEAWAERLKARRKGPAPTLRLVKLEDNMRVFLMDLDSIHYEDQQDLKHQMFNKLFDVLIPFMAKLKGRTDKTSDPVLEHLAPHVDFEAKFKTAKPTAKALLGDYIVRCRRDLMGLLTTKKRGQVLEDELGL